MKKKARYYKKLDNKVVKCEACSHKCVIPEGKVGICGIRQNINGDLYLLNYGLPVAIHIDPIEKKPLYHFYPGSKALSIGFTGCNFRCSFCQNWDIAQFPILKAKEIGREATNKMIETTGYEMSPKQLVDYAIQHKIKSIAYTYNEPTISLEFVMDTSVLARKAGLKNVWVSNGYINKDILSDVAKYIDAINIDLKSFNEKFYIKHCKGKLDFVKDNIRAFIDAGVWVEVAVLIIPGENDSEKELQSIATFLYNISPDIPIHFNRFYPDFKMLDKPITPVSTLRKAYNIAKGVGCRYVYTGNLREPAITKCPYCGSPLIERFPVIGGYQVSNNGLTCSSSGAMCRNCGKGVEVKCEGL